MPDADEQSKIETDVPTILLADAGKTKARMPIFPLIVSGIFLLLTIVAIVNFYVFTSAAERAILWGDLDRLNRILAEENNINAMRIGRQSLLAFTLAYKDHSVNPLRLMDDTGKIAELARRNQVRMAMIEAILNRGADINLLDDNGLAILHYSILNHIDTNSKIELIQMLLTRGADPNLKITQSKMIEYGTGWCYGPVENTLGGTALHLAAANDELEIVQILLENNADTELTNNGGQTPLQIAAEKDLSEIASLLRSHTHQ